MTLKRLLFSKKGHTNTALGKLLTHLVYFNYNYISLPALRLSSSTSWPWIILLCSIIYVITIIGTFYLTKRFIKPVDLALNKNNTPVAPNYDSYANQYSSLPTKDVSYHINFNQRHNKNYF